LSDYSDKYTERIQILLPKSDILHKLKLITRVKLNSTY